MIQLNNINVFFGKDSELELHILKSISCNIAQGEFVAILGGNGAGKSTLINAISGIVGLNSGSIIINGNDVSNQQDYQRASFIAKVFQDPTVGTISDFTIEENLSLALYRNKKRDLKLSLTKEKHRLFQKILKKSGIELENRLQEKVSALSGGQRQALSLIMATLVDCKILLLDEHISALDVIMQEKVMKLTYDIVRKKKVTTLMITHSLSYAMQYCDRIIVLTRGKISLDQKLENRNQISREQLLEYFVE